MRTKERRKPITFSSAALIGALAAALAIASGSTALAINESPVPAGSATESAAPPPPPPESMSVVPEEGPSAAPTPSSAAKKKTTHHAKKSTAPVEVEPATARLRISRDTWIFSGPSKWTRHITRGHAGKFVEVSGSTKYYLQVRLKDGQTGYISPSDVDLVKPSDNVFQLTQDAAVLQEPNRWSKKLSEVHRGHNVHVTGVSLNYMRIRMKSGVVGFIPASAMQ